MADESVKQAREKISAFIEHFQPDPITRSLKFLVGCRNSDGAWGRVRSSVSELRTTSLALKLFIRNKEYLKFGELEDGIEFLRKNLLAISQPTDGRSASIEEVAISIPVLALHDPESILVREMGIYLSGLQNEDGGWGEGTSRVDVTSAALLSLTYLQNGKTPKAALRKGTIFLESAANADGGLGVSKGAPSSAIQTAKAILALLAMEGTDDRFQKGLSYLTTVLNKDEGYWGLEDQSDVLYATGVGLKSFVLARNDKNSSDVQRAVTFLLSNQRKDGGWGWSVGGISEVEPTAVILDALFEAGITEYAPVSIAIELLKGAIEETEVLKRQNHAIQKEIDAQVSSRISNIIETRDKLDQRVKQLETDNKRLNRQVPELERLRSESLELRRLRFEKTQLRGKLQEALLLASGQQSSSPENLLREMENFIVDHKLQTDPGASDTILRVLDYLPDISPIERERFIRDFDERLAQDSSDLISSQFFSYISLLPVDLSQKTVKDIRRLMDRIRQGTVRHRPVRNPANIATQLANLEVQVARLQTLDGGIAREFLDRFRDIWVDIPEEDAVRFSEYMEERFAPASWSPAERRVFQKTMADLVKLKTDPGKESMVHEHIQQMINHLY